jgi:septal ring-binding cell division protein DamX
VPDLNLKGEEEHQAPSQEPAGHRRGAILISVLAGTLVIVIAVFVVVKLGLLQPQEREATQPEPQSTFKADTISQKVRLDTLTVDSSKTRIAPAISAALPESSSVSVTDTSAQVRGSGKFTIQLSAWRSGMRAAAELRRLKGFGLDVYLTQSEPDSVGMVWNRIRMGHYHTLDEAKRFVGGLLDTLVVGYTFEKED